MYLIPQFRCQKWDQCFPKMNWKRQLDNTYIISLWIYLSAHVPFEMRWAGGEALVNCAFWSSEVNLVYEGWERRYMRCAVNIKKYQTQGTESPDQKYCWCKLWVLCIFMSRAFIKVSDLWQVHSKQSLKGLPALSWPYLKSLPDQWSDACNSSARSKICFPTRR